MDDPDETWVPEPSPKTNAAPEVLVGRYTLAEQIGRGGSGTVYAAHDRLTGDRVAVKLVPMLGAHARRQLRRELSALLALRLPGVARFRDEGTITDKTFFVTDLIDGVPFDQEAGQGWEAWRPRVIGLLDVIARVHLAGVIHRDLKPANVMVDRSGQVILLDFGLAQGRIIERHSQGLIEGSPRYMAPEQREGRACDERTDLYAAGGMIWELVTGERLTRCPDLSLLRTAGVPDALVTIVSRMLSERPDDRPSSALEVLAALGADPRDQIGSALPPGPWSEETLRALFVDRKRSFLHLAEDAAALLFEATGGEEQAVRQQIVRWIGAGLASWADGGKVRITRQAIEQIAASRRGGPQSELVALLEAGAEPDEVSAAARRIGASMADSGHLESALSLLDAADLWAKGTPFEIELLQDRVVWSLALETPAAAERALIAVQRVEMAPEQRSGLVALLRGGRAAFAGEAQRALEYLADKPEGLAEPLELYWHGVRWKAVSQLDLDTHERELLAIEGWAQGSLLRTSKWKGWLGYLRYLQQRYPEAAALLLDAEQMRSSSRERAQLLYMAAAAQIEIPSLDEAHQTGTRAQFLFQEGRHSTLEAMAAWLLRMVMFRRGVGVPDLELVEAARDTPSIERHIALTEAGFAFRCRQSDVCLELISIVQENPHQKSADPVGLLAAALSAAIAPDSVDVEHIVEQVDGLTPQVAIQTLGLCACASVAPEAWRTRARRLLGQLVSCDPDQRLELVSLREACTWLGIEAELPPRPRSLEQVDIDRAGSWYLD